jgi:hypothetical protein
MKVLGWIELVAVSLFVLWLAVSAWPLAISLGQKFAADTGGESMVMMLFGAVVLVPILMSLRMQSRLDGYLSEPSVVATGIGLAIFMTWCAATPWLVDASEGAVVLADLGMTIAILCLAAWQVNVWLDTCFLPEHFHDSRREQRRIRAPA